MHCNTLRAQRASLLTLLAVSGLCLRPGTAVAAPEYVVLGNQTAIPRAESKEFDLPARGKSSFLTITTRLDAKILSGSNFLMNLAIDGKTLGGTLPDGESRLKNRPLNSPITPTLSAPWYGAPYGWRVLYAPDFEGGRKARYYVGDPYTLVLDVTDLLPTDRPAKLKVTNTTSERAAAAAGTNAELIVAKITQSDSYTPPPGEGDKPTAGATATATTTQPAGNAAGVTVATAGTSAGKPATVPVTLQAGPLRNGEIAVIGTETRIPREGTRAFEFGTVPQENSTVYMEITSRMDAKEVAGSSTFLSLKLNGKEVRGAKTRTLVRLKNRGLNSPVTPTISSFWFSSPMGWRVVYAPDFESARKQTFYEGDPYTILLDVTDLVNPAAENRLEITNTAKPQAVSHAGTQAELVINKLTIRTVPGTSPLMATGAVGQDYINRGERAGGPARYTGQLLPGGGFQIKVGQRSWNVQSAFSYPNAGLNPLVPASRPAGGEPGWNVAVQSDKNGGTVQARSKYYTLRRQVRFTPRKVTVEDTITNLTSSPLGMLVRHETDLAGLDDPVVRLAGSSDPDYNDYFSPGNPSVHISAPDHTLGMICEDDVLRNQARLYTRETPAATGTPAAATRAPAQTVAGFRTDMLRLGPGESHTLRWSVYPVASRDYFDFVNLVRQDWGANITVDGAWYWGYVPDQILAMPLEEIRERFQRYGIRYAIVGGGWVDRTKDPKRIGFGAGVLDDYWADYRLRIRNSARRIREAVPGCKVLVYIDSQRDTSEGGAERFKDSALTDSAGTHLSTGWSGQFSLTYSQVATNSNSFGRAMLDVADRYMDEMELDGIYWDEMENVGFGTPLLTYNVGDGRSCELDPVTYTIKREVGNTVLLGESNRLAIIDRIRKKGGVVMGNGPTCTRALLSTGVQRMTEIQHNELWAYEGHLQTPLGYMGSRMDFGNVVRGLRMACLPVGTRFNYDYDISRHLFPFTPVELHAGYLLGKERIITLHNGEYGWDGMFRYRLWIYGADGKVKDPNPVWKTANVRVPVEVPQGGVAILERAPAGN